MHRFRLGVRNCGMFSALNRDRRTFGTKQVERRLRAGFCMRVRMKRLTCIHANRLRGDLEQVSMVDYPEMYEVAPATTFIWYYPFFAVMGLVVINITGTCFTCFTSTKVQMLTQPTASSSQSLLLGSLMRESKPLARLTTRSTAYHPPSILMAGLFR
jgi:hypothetical protein